MTVTINNPIVYGLVPNHYVGIDNSGAAAGRINALPQTLLVIGTRNPSSLERLASSSPKIATLRSDIVATDAEIKVANEEKKSAKEAYELASVAFEALADAVPADERAIAEQDVVEAKKLLDEVVKNLDRLVDKKVSQNKDLSYLLEETKFQDSTVTTGQISEVVSEDKAIELYGRDSQLHKMFKKIFKANPGASAYGTSFLTEPTNSEMVELIANLPEMQYTQVVFPFNAQNILSTLNGEMKERWKADRAIDGQIFCAFQKSNTSHEQMFSAFDTEHITVMVTEGESEPAEWAASLAGVNSRYATEPSRPYQTLELPGIKGPAKTYDQSVRNNYLNKGISTFKMDSESVRIERLVTTYKTRNGAPDISYRDLNWKQTVSYLRYDLRQAFFLNFPRHMLAPDGVVAAGPVLTPTKARAFIVSRFRMWQRMNLVVDPGEMFSKTVQAEIDIREGTRLLIVLFPQLMNQYRQTHAEIRFLI